MFDKRIITIHDVAEDTMTSKRLEKIIKTTLGFGYKFVAIDQILETNTKGLKVALTVDDAYKSTVTTTMPILTKYNIKAILFIPPGLIGLKANDPVLLANDCYPNKDMMTWDDVQEWVNQGHEIGFHTCNHIDLYHNSCKDIEDDFIKGMNIFITQGLQVKLFAYPKGYLPKNRKQMEELFKRFGIHYAFTINRGRVNVENIYYINRTILGNKEYFLWSLFKIFGIEDYHYYSVKQHQEAKM